MNVEFVDRYTDTPHEHKPWVRGCFGDCEAMGWYPTLDPRAWPPVPDHLVGTLVKVGAKIDLPEYRTTLVYVGPEWKVNRSVRLVDEPDDPEWRDLVAGRGWWVPEAAVDDGWAFVMCPICNGTGTRSFWVGVGRLLRLWEKSLASAWCADGAQGWPPSVGFPTLKTRWFFVAYAAKETWKLFTWRAPEGLR